jgi:ferric-dicitrate binding protein FerR (iron transport regulator)
MRQQQAIIRLMAFEAFTLAIASTLHLSGAGRRGTAAGVAEALICLALVFGAYALASGRRWGQTAATAATGFAIFGFVLGLSLTLGGGDTLDIAYHASMLPVLIITAILLTRLRQPRPQA